MPSSQDRSSVPSSALLCAGNLVNIRSTQKLLWIPLFHMHGHHLPSLWVTGMTHFESVDLICQIWPIRGYTRGWYTGTGRLKKWLQAPPPLLSPVSSRFIFVFVLSQFSGPDYLGAWNRLRWMWNLQPYKQVQLSNNKFEILGDMLDCNYLFWHQHQILHRTTRKWTQSRVLSTAVNFFC